MSSILYLFRHTIRQKTMLWASLGMLFLGMYAIYNGQQHRLALQNEATFIQPSQQAQHQLYASYYPDDMGLLMYYLRFGVAYNQPKISALGFAQDQNNLRPMQLNIRNLEAQKYDTAIQNPLSSSIGALDLNFMVIYVLPIYILLLSFNFYPEEASAQRILFVAVFAPKHPPLWQQKAKLLLLMILALVLGWSLFAGFYLGLGFITLLIYIAAVMLYASFWLLWMLWLNQWGRDAKFNLNMALATWLGLLIIVPSALQSYSQYRYPAPEALATAYQQRNAYHQKWDESKATTMQKFYMHYPQFKHYPLPNKTFSWLWYYAMQDMGDYESRQQSQAFAQKIKERHAFYLKTAQFLPNLATQELFNQMGDHGSLAQLRFWEQAGQYHEGLKMKFYPLVFQNLKPEAYPFGQDQVYHIPAQEGHTKSVFWLILALINLLLWLAIYLQPKKNKAHD